MVLVCATPFGWIAGQMSEINRNLPFVLIIVIFALGGLLTYLVGRLVRGGEEVGQVAAG